MEYSEEAIESLLSCQKEISEPPSRQMRDEQGSYRKDLKLVGVGNDAEFHVFIRQNKEFPDGFSVGLRYLPKDGSKSHTLLRCNGPHYYETDRMDEDYKTGFHIHRAKAENISIGMRAERGGELTSEYGTLEDALRYFFTACNVRGGEAYFPFLAAPTLF